jgi:hypothetical protein
MHAKVGPDGGESQKAGFLGWLRCGNRQNDRGNGVVTLSSDNTVNSQAIAGHLFYKTG